MALDQKPTSLPAEMKIEEPEGGTFSCYSNQMVLAWTAQDVKIEFFEMVNASEKMPSTFDPRMERLAVVTVSWVQAKEIARLFNTVVGKYEELNGPLPSPSEIKVP